MSDYPDYTSLLQIVGSDIMVPIDLQGAYIMMPVDIQAQYVTLNIDIVAQSIGAININLTSISGGITLNVNLTASSVTINISIAAQQVAILDQPTWSAINAQDKNIITVGSDLGYAETAYTDYQVTAGKTLFLCGMSFSVIASAVGDAEKPQYANVYLRNQTDGVDLAYLGGDCGGSVIFQKPVKVVATKHVRAWCVCACNHDVNIILTTWGYEI
jgi:hypothetical protein